MTPNSAPDLRYQISDLSLQATANFDTCTDRRSPTYSPCWTYAVLIIASIRSTWPAVAHDLTGDAWPPKPALARLAAQLYPEDIRIDDTGMLTRPDWTPGVPVPLEGIKISLDDQTSAPAIDGQADDVNGVLPLAMTDDRSPGTATP